MFDVTRPAHWTLMIAPVRFEMLEAMRGVAPCSVGELAAALDRPADSLYPHLRQLVKIGVVREAGARAGRTRPEKIYDLAADDFRPVFRDAGAKVAGRVVDRSIQTMAGIVARTSRKTGAAGRYVYTEAEQNVVGKIETAWLTAEEFAGLREKLRGIKRYLDKRKKRRAGTLHLAAFFVVPVTRSRGARVKNDVERKGTGKVRGGRRGGNASTRA